MKVTAFLHTVGVSFLFIILIVCAAFVVYVTAMGYKDQFPLSYGIVNPGEETDGVEYGTLFFGAKMPSKFASYNNCYLAVCLDGELTKVNALVTYSYPSDYNPREDSYLIQMFNGSLESTVSVQVRTVLFCETVVSGEEGLRLKSDFSVDDLPKIINLLNAPVFSIGSDSGPHDSFLPSEVKITGISILDVKR